MSENATRNGDHRQAETVEVEVLPPRPEICHDIDTLMENSRLLQGIAASAGNLSAACRAQSNEVVAVKLKIRTGEPATQMSEYLEALERQKRERRDRALARARQAEQLPAQDQSQGQTGADGMTQEELNEVARIAVAIMEQRRKK